MSPAERRALFLLLSLGLLGQGVRWWVNRPGDAPGEVHLLSALPPRSPGPHRDSILALARPLGPDERIDADRATAPELARLKLMKILSDLREAMWAMVQVAISTLDYDFVAYGQKHFERYAGQLRDPRLPAWLADVAASG